MNKGWFFGTLTLGVFLNFLLFNPVIAQNDLIPGSQSPKATLDSIWAPVIGFINGGVRLVNDIVDHLLDFNWLRSKVVGIFDWISDLVQRVTGKDLGEILRLAGGLIINIFNLVIVFARKLWPF
ncbi:MAG: hypothetical protein HY093_00640 [Candidatus Liptonbacteria bacterium]|nr:hypothetical protein [Candidatus Liptonbacteria bacterium]